MIKLSEPPQTTAKTFFVRSDSSTVQARVARPEKIAKFFGNSLIDLIVGSALWRWMSWRKEKSKTSSQKLPML